MSSTTKSRSYNPKTKTNSETTTYRRNDGSGHSKTTNFKMTGGGLFRKNVSSSRTDFGPSKRK